MNYRLWADELLDHYQKIQNIYISHKDVVCDILAFMKEFNGRDEWTDEQKDAVVLFTDEMIRRAISNRPPEFVVTYDDIDEQVEEFRKYNHTRKARALIEFENLHFIRNYAKWFMERNADVHNKRD